LIHTHENLPLLGRPCHRKGRNLYATVHHSGRHHEKAPKKQHVHDMAHYKDDDGGSSDNSSSSSSSSSSDDDDSSSKKHAKKGHENKALEEAEKAMSGLSNADHKKKKGSRQPSHKRFGTPRRCFSCFYTHAFTTVFMHS
jgi:hypothetical protein